MRELVVNQLKLEYNKLQGELEKLEKEISVLSGEFLEEKKIKKLARMAYAEEFNRQNLNEISAANKSKQKNNR